MDETTTTAPPAPYLLYENASAALAWLATAFGFTETLRFAGPDGAVRHAEMRCGGGVVMLGQPADYQSPKRSGHRCSLVVVTVDDVDAHFAHAKAAGATIVSAAYIGRTLASTWQRSRATLVERSVTS